VAKGIRLEEQAFVAACNIMGESVWKIMPIGELVKLEIIAKFILTLSVHRDHLAASIALYVLLQL